MILNVKAFQDKPVLAKLLVLWNIFLICLVLKQHLKLGPSALTFFGVFKSVCLCTYHVCCYFLHGKITDIYTCMQSVYVVVVFMNTPNLLFTLNMFLSSLFTYFYKIIHIYFHQFVNNLYYMLSIFVKMQIIYSFDSNKSKLNSLSMCCKNKTAGH